jgi:hypothetical protein
MSVGLLFVIGAAGPAMAQTTYPVASAIELRDANGNLINSTTPTCPKDGISVHATGWLANSVVHATFHSDPVDLGPHAVDAAGALDFMFRVENVDPGMHTLHLEGTGADGQPRVIEASILCQCTAPPAQPSAVLGETLASRSGDTAARSGNGIFAKTGLDVNTILAIAVDLVLVGVVLQLARPRTA